MTVRLSKRLTFTLAILTLALLTITVMKGELDDPGNYFLAAMLSNLAMMTMLLIHVYLKNKAKTKEAQG